MGKTDCTDGCTVEAEDDLPNITTWHAGLLVSNISLD